MSLLNILSTPVGLVVDDVDPDAFPVAADPSLDALAGVVIANMPVEREGLPPRIALATVVKVLKAVLLAFECLMLLGDADVRRVRRPGLLQRLKLRVVARRVLAAAGSVDELDAVVAALLKTGATASLDAINDVIRLAASGRTSPGPLPADRSRVDAWRGGRSS